MRYEVLGGIEVVTDDEGMLPLGGPTQHRLLGALLVEANHTVSVDRLAEALFDGAEVENSVKAVRTYVSRLRSVVGEGTVATTAGGYRLAVDPGSVDAQRFSELVRGASVAREAGDAARAVALCDEALILWRGRPFSPFSDEPWAVGDVVRLEELRWVAKEERLDARLALGAHAEVAGEAEAMTLEAPMRERPVAARMKALYRSGRHAEALRAFQTFREQLAEETGLEPSPELVRLESRILNRDPSLDLEGRGRAIKGYELHEKIAEGAFGAIYRGVQPSVGREVAIKVVKPELADDPRFITRFEAEAQLVARLEHPHIVPLYDFWREPGGAYLVMRYLRGGSAEERLVQRGPFTLNELTLLVEQVGTGLAVAHAAGVVHRDVKPANVLYDDGGNAYLGDFGIAYVTGGTSQPTDPLRSAGSPLYAAPELLDGAEATIASDVYAFGVLLWELLTGGTPFDASSMTSLRRAKASASTPSLADVRAELPSAVDLVVRTATAPDPAKRFADMGELVLAWRSAALSAGRGITTSLPSAEREANRPRAQASRTLVSLQEQRVNPYKGLRPFGEADTAEFFGREKTTASLVAAVADSRFVAVVGPSGSGKSSVVRAGLVPALRREGAWVAITVPGAHPFDEVENALLRLAPGSVPSLLEQLTADERGLVRAVKRVLPDDDTELVLIVDQFEELFTLSPSETTGAFTRALACAASDDRSRLRVLITLRADFYDRPLAMAGFGELVRDHTIAVTPLDADELVQAITGPAERVGLTVEPALVVELVADATANPASLPLLQYALTELYERREPRMLTLSAYRDLGGLSGSVASRADALCDEIGDVASVRLLFERLVTPGDGVEDTRRRAHRSELTGVPDEVIDAFGTARLLAFDHDPVTREPSVEIAHESLLRTWPRLRAWLDEDRESLRILRHLSDAAAAWETRGREPGDLYRGARLVAAGDVLASHPERLTAMETEFVAASAFAAQADDRRRRRATHRLRALAVGLGITLVGALIAGAVAVSQRNEAQDQRDIATGLAADAEQAAFDAKVGEMVAQAGLLAESNPSLAMLLALEADRLRPDPDSLGALETALVARPELLDTVHADTRYVHVLPDFSDPTGARIAGGTNDGRIVVEDTVSGLVVEEWKVSDGPVTGWGSPGQRYVAVPAGTEVLVRDPDGSVRTLVDDGVASAIIGFVPITGSPARPNEVWVATESGVRVVDVASGSTLRTLAVSAALISLSGDGTRLAVESSGPPWTVTVIDAETGKDVGPTVDLESSYGISLDQSGTRLALGSFGNGDVHLVDVTTGRTLGEPLLGENLRFAFNASGSRLAAASSTGVIRVFDTATGSAVGRDLKVGEGAVGLAFSSDDKTLLAISPGGDIQVLDLAGRSKLSRPVAWDHAWAAAFSPDGTILAMPSTLDNDVALVDAATGEIQRVLHPAQHFLNWGQGVTDGVFRPAFSPDGTAIAIGSAASDGNAAEIEIFSVSDGRSLRRLPVPGVPFLGEPLAWSPDGRVIAATSAHEGVIRVDSTTGARLDDVALPRPLLVWQLAYDADGRLLVSASFGTTLVYDSSGHLIDTYADISFATWAPSGSVVLPGYTTGAIKLIDVTTGKQDGQTFAGPKTFTVPAVSPDGRRGVAITGTNVLRLWDVETGDTIGVPILLSSEGAWNAVSNGTIAVASDPEHHGMAIWDLDPAVWRVRACEAAGRNLTHDEWARFLPESEPYHATCAQYPAG